MAEALPKASFPAQAAAPPRPLGAPTAKGGLRAWLVERLGLKALAYPVPEHANGLLYTLGGITLVGFIVLIITGIYLAQFYHPDPADAYTSVIYIMGSAPFGDLVRAIHYWTAMVVSVTVTLHLLRVFFSGAYKAPREANWLIGLGLLALTMGFVFTGTVLKWDQEGVEALAHNQAAASLLGGLGGWFSTDFSLSVPVLTRLFFAHVSILPALLTVLLAGHVFLIKVHGMAPLGRADGRDVDPLLAQADPATRYREPAHPFTSHLRTIAGWGSLLVAIILALSIAFVPPLGSRGVAGMEVTKPPFMYWWLYAAEDALGIRGLLIIPAVFFLLLAIVPFADSGYARRMGKRKAIVIVGALVVVLLLALTIYTGLTPPVAHTQMG